MEHLTICYDPGTSLSKILYQRENSSQIKYLTMEPELMVLPPSSLSNLPVNSGLGKPEDNAWVRLKKSGDCYAVGRVAIEYRATMSMNKLKYESLTPKILAAIGAIATKENLGNKFKLNLGVLIPFGEYANKDELASELKSELSSFYFQHERYQISLESYRCVAEGAGLALAFVRYKSVEEFRNLNIAYLMLGYRNTSLLLFRQGTLSQKQSNTTQLGFYDLIDKLISKVSGLSRDEVQSAIATSIQEEFDQTAARQLTKQITKIVVEDLIKATDPEKAQKETEELKAAITTATEEYWRLLKSWLQEVLLPSRQLDSLVLCGGAGEFFTEQLEQFCNQEKISLVRTGSVTKEMLEYLELDSYQEQEFKEKNLGLRFADVWGYFSSQFARESIKEAAA